MTALREEALWISPEEYLEGEKLSPIKHEYVEGRVFAMAGASADHGLIAANILAELHNQLRGKKCQTFASDMKVQIPPMMPNHEITFYYPDVVVACEPEKELDPFYRDFPSAIFEVLSPSTQTLDLREKRINYLKIESLEYYCIVAQDRMEVTVYRRKSANWEIMQWRQPEDVIYLGAIDCELTLAQIYERVSWNVAA